MHVSRGFKPAAARISVVIPARNGSTLLLECLAGLERQTVERTTFEVIVVDDGSNEDLASVVTTPGVTVLRQPHRGAAAARNHGVRVAKSEVVALLDADCVPERDWLETITRPLFEGDAVGAVGRFVSAQREWVARLVQIELERRYRRMREQTRIDFVNTATCAFLKKTLEAEPFDETFWKLEDIELSFRLSRRGLTVTYVDDAVVRHHHPTSLWHYTSRKFLYGKTAPRLYNRFPSKAMSDSSTPSSRRLQILLLALAAAAVPFSYLLSALSLVASLTVSLPVILDASRHSLLLGALSPVLSLAGSIAFVTGSAVGALDLARRRVFDRQGR